MTSLPLFGPLTGKIGAYIAYQANWQESVLKVMCVLPGGYRYETVAAAIRAADVRPSDIYECILAQQNTFSLLRFYAVLGKQV